MEQQIIDNLVHHNLIKIQGDDCYDQEDEKYQQINNKIKIIGSLGFYQVIVKENKPANNFIKKQNTVICTSCIQICQLSKISDKFSLLFLRHCMISFTSVIKQNTCRKYHFYQIQRNLFNSQIYKSSQSQKFSCHMTSLTQKILITTIYIL
ncbi:hypothetical protein ABPG72_013367 [Tetrahymena utriculariae]